MKGGKGKGVAKVSKEALKPVDDRKVGKRKVVAKVDKSSTLKAKKAKKDPNKPKRPPSAFFVFLEEFRKTFKKDNPHIIGVSAVAKAAGEKWKSMSPAVEEETQGLTTEGEAVHVYLPLRMCHMRRVSRLALEKAPYEIKAAKAKAEYGKLLNAYNKKQESMTDDGDEESEKSKSEVHDEEDEAIGEEEHDEDEEEEEEEDDD